MRFGWVTGLLLALGMAAGADVLETRDGRLLEGVYRGGTQQAVRFEVGGSVEVVPLDQVLALTFDRRTAKTTQTPAAPAPARRSPEAKPNSQTRGGSPAASAKVAPPPIEKPPATPRAEAPAEAATSAATPAAPPLVARIPAGTRLRVRIIDAIDPRLSATGDRFSATLEIGLAVDHAAIAPVGSKVYGQVAELRSTGPVASRLKLELNQLMLQGQLFDIVTGPHQVAQAEEEPGPASASTIPVRPGFAPGTLLEFRLLQPFEVQIR